MNDTLNPQATQGPPRRPEPAGHSYRELWMRTGLARGTRMLWRGRPLKDYSPAELVAIIGMLQPEDAHQRPEATVRSLTWVIGYLTGTMACNRRRVSETDNLNQALVALRAARDRETQLGHLVQDAVIAAHELAHGQPESSLNTPVWSLRERAEQMGVTTDDMFTDYPEED